jgi:nonribosomal peptide synthetase DhbF
LLALFDAYPVAEMPSQKEAMASIEQDVLRALTGIAHHQAIISKNQSVAFANALEILRGQGSALASLKDQHFSRIANIFANNIKLMGNFVPSRLDGDLLLFIATTDQPKNAPTADVWRQYVDGAIEIHPITCGHYDMMTQHDSLDQIGPILAAKLQLIRDPRYPPPAR